MTLFYSLACVLFVAGAYAILDADEHKKVVEECKAQSGCDDEDVKATEKYQVPNTDKGKVFFDCFMSKNLKGLKDDNGDINKQYCWKFAEKDCGNKPDSDDCKYMKKVLEKCCEANYKEETNNPGGQMVPLFNCIMSMKPE